MRRHELSSRNRSGRRVSRRRFLGGLTLGGAAAAAFPLVVPSSSLGKDGTVAPSNRIGLGVIGCGGKGTGGMQNFMRLADVRVAALCDPKATSRARAAAVANVDEKSTYADFRELLARRDVDAVLVATPDHWHVLTSIAAAKAGKDVYCEKPLANTIAEGRALVETMHRYGTVFQHGTQLRSMIGTHMACELVRNGRLGELKGIRIGSPPGLAIAPQPAMPVPDWLNYDLWLGPAPMAPYTTERCTTGWYFISDYSKSGWVAGFGVHDIDIAQWAIGMERTGPVEIEGHGVFPADGLFDTVLTYRLEFRYANGVTITMTDTGRNRHGVLFEGTRGTIFTRGGIECNPPELLQEKIGPNEEHLYASRNHEANFIECVKSRAATITPAEVAHRSASTSLLGGIALQLGRKLRWDPAAERFVNDPEADRLLSYAMREPWSL